MGVINIPQPEQDALRAIDIREMDRLIEQAMREESAAGLYRLHLGSCGSYVSTRLCNFARALGEYRAPKSVKKRAEKRYTAQRAGSDLLFAVQGMKHRIAESDKDAQFFYIDDQIMPPMRVGKHMQVAVSYRWRRTIDDEWTRSSITFIHDAETRPDYTVPLPKRKISAAKQERDLQDRLYRIWENLTRLALCTVRDYLQSGGDGNAIPKTFRTTVDSRIGGLNNYSTNFWREKAVEARP